MQPIRADDLPFFEVTHASPSALSRVGWLHTAHGSFETPCFLPIASHGTLRALSFEQAKDCGTAVIMANAWYIFQMSGPEALRQAGGAHDYLGWNGCLFTDSGGYQVFSLKDQSKLEDAGVSFGEGGEILTPERVVEMQKHLGSDIMMSLDDCAPYPCTTTRARDAVRRTSLWAVRSMTAHRGMAGLYGHRQHLYGIVQGSVYEALRRQSVEEIGNLGFDGFGIGGLSIGMPRAAIREMTALCSELLVPDAPRHLLGVGLPWQILEGIADGADTFDCVLPIRKAQRGVAYTRSGELYYKRPHPASHRDRPLEPSCQCNTCTSVSREQLRLLFKSDKAAAGTRAAIHNLYFYHQVATEARAAIKEDRLDHYIDDFREQWDSGQGL